MATNRVAEMTLEELNKLIEEVVDCRLEHLLKPSETRSTSELLEILDRHRIVPPPGSKSAREMIREGRDAWSSE